jgi:hypothetical protein
MAGRTFQPEDRIAHCCVVGTLGTGGMGEVYIARERVSGISRLTDPSTARGPRGVRRSAAQNRFRDTRGGRMAGSRTTRAMTSYPSLDPERG